MSKLPVFTAVMLLWFIFSSATAQSIPSSVHIPRERATLSYDNQLEFTRLATWGNGSVFDVAWMDATHIAFTSESGTWVYELGEAAVAIRLLAPPYQRLFAASNSNWVMTYTDNERFNSFPSNSFDAWSLTGESRQLLAVSQILGDAASTLSPVMNAYGVIGNDVIGSQGATTFVWPDDFSNEAQRFEQPPSNRTDYVIEQATLSNDGKHLATAARAFISDQLIISVWDTETGQQRIIYEDDYLPLQRLILNSLQFSEDGHELAAYIGFVTRNKLEMRLRRWNVTTDQELNSISLECPGDDYSTGTVNYVNYAANFFLCRFSAADGKARLEVRSLDTGLLRASVADSSFEPNYAISPNSRYIALANATRYTSGGDELARYRIVVWDIERDRLFAEFEGSVDAVTSLEFSPDGRQLLSGNDDGTLRIWNIGTKTQSYFIEAGHSLPVTSVAFSPDGRWLVSVATNPNSNYLGASRGFVASWNLETGQFEKLLDGADSRATSAVFSPDGKRLYIGDLEGSLHIWDGETFKPIQTLTNGDPINSMALSADGRLLAIASDYSMSVWDTRSNSIVNRLEYELYGNSCLAQFSPDGEWLKLCARLWKIEDQGKLIAEWQAADLPEALTAWYESYDRRILFTSDNGDNPPIQWLPPGSSDSFGSVAINAARDLIAAGQPNGVITFYGIEKEG